MIVVPILVAETSGNQRVQALLQLAQREFEATKRRRDEDQELAEITIPREDISDELIEDLRSSASSLGYDSFEKAVVSLQSIRAGKPRSISAGWTFVESLLGYLELEFIDGWLYRRSELGFLQAIRLDSINRDHYGGYSLHGRAADIKSGSFHLTMGLGRTRGLPSTILNDLNLLRETPELKAEYLAQVAHFIEVAGNDPGHQAVADGLWSFGLADYEVSNILASGRMQDANRNRKAFERVGSRRVVVESELNGELRGVLERQIAGEVIAPRVGVDEAELEALPLSPLVEVFDLSGEGDRLIATNSLKSYSYREDIRSQLVLPESHSRVIEVLTARTTSTLADVIHGKGAGNLVLCKGIPGVGKTLTAEIVAESLKRPMYTVDASSILGAQSVREAMNAAFDRVRRWDGVLLLDEADVVIGARGNDLERNRVTAELLRSLESFERLAFLTTNRPEDVDDAIISRCVAIIEYKAPTGDAAKRAWQILGDQLEEGFVSEGLAETASVKFHAMAPRDIRQLLRLSFQMAKADGKELSLETLEDCAVFRAWQPVL